MKRSTKGLLVGSGIAAAGFTVGAAHRAISGFFANVALDRQAPRHRKGAERLLSGSGIPPEYVQALADAAQRLERAGAETVETVSHDGITLVGHWLECENPKRVVIAMHGWRSSWSHDFGLGMDCMRENGCSVLFAEQRGQGSSGGEYMGFGLLERHDCLDWIRWAEQKTGGRLPIYLHGISMGASTVLMAAGLELPQSVKGIIADCGYTSPAAIWQHVAKKNLHLSYRLYGPAVNGLCRKKIQMRGDEYSSVDAMRQCRVPVLFIHGTADHFVPVEMTYENYAACAAPKRMLIVPGAEHGMSYLVDTERYQQELKNFWQDHDA